MSTVKLEAPLDELPAKWRAERQLHEGDTIVVTVKSTVTQSGKSFWEAAQRAAGIWADRTDEEIEAWQAEMREARKRRFESLFPEQE